MKRAPKFAVHVAAFENNDSISAETEAIQDRIRQRAFELSQTRPSDAHALYDWAMAEAEVISVPPAELVEKDGKFELRFAVAGVNPEDVRVTATPDQILIKSEYNHEHDADIGTVHLCDFKSATVFRTVSLPQPIDVKSVSVHLERGMILVSATTAGVSQARPKRPAPARKAAAKKS
jgi:HSP20 family molecular chaperone IbpA